MLIVWSLARLPNPLGCANSLPFSFSQSLIYWDPENFGLDSQTSLHSTPSLATDFHFSILHPSASLLTTTTEQLHITQHGRRGQPVQGFPAVLL
jgi:hypothetical protein